MEYTEIIRQLRANLCRTTYIGRKKMKKFIAIIISALLLICMLPILSVSASEDSTSYEYGRSLLSANAAYIYDEFAHGVTADTPAQKIELDRDRGVLSADVTAGVNAFISDHPEVFWIDGSCGYSTINNTVVDITPNYTYSGADLTRAKAALEAEVTRILEGLPTTNNYDKALYLHDALAAHTSYIKVGDHQTAYGALVGKKAVCAGYAAAYQLLMKRAGIPTWTVEGSSIDSRTGQVVPHAWNLVWLSDGVCVYTDVTWDDQGEELYHTYFNTSLAQMADSHFPEQPSQLPECTHDGYDYATIKGLRVDLEDEDSLGEMISKFKTQSKDVYVATVVCDENKIESWLKANAGDIATALGGNGGYSYVYKNLGDEVHLTFTLGEAAQKPADSPLPSIKGCGLALSGGAIAVMLSLLAAGCVVKKRK